MMRSLTAAAALALSLSTAPAIAHQGAGHLMIDAAFARITTPSRPAAAYLTIENTGAADRLIRATSPAFGRVELHTHEMSGGLMRMLKVEAIDVPRGGVALKPGGHHLMLFGPTAPLAVGDSFPLTLEFETTGAIELVVPVTPLGQDQRGEAALDESETTREHSHGDHSGHGDHSAHGGHGGHGDHSGHTH